MVEETYKRPYSFQQQWGCKDRGSEQYTVPDSANDDRIRDTVPEIINGEEMCVSFAGWLARDPKQEFEGHVEGSYSALNLWWSRNFYPDTQIVLNDLHSKGLIPAGDYTINIDW